GRALPPASRTDLAGVRRTSAERQAHTSAGTIIDVRSGDMSPGMRDMRSTRPDAPRASSSQEFSRPRRAWSLRALAPETRSGMSPEGSPCADSLRGLSRLRRAWSLCALTPAARPGSPAGSDHFFLAAGLAAGFLAAGALAAGFLAAGAFGVGALAA